MKYLSTDIKQYTQAKEYVDTAILSLIPYSFNSDQELLQLAKQKELIQLYASQIESELKGRVFSLPEYYYLKQDKILDEEKVRLKEFISHLNQQPFEYIFLITSDSKWRKASKDLDAELIWLPGFSRTEMNQEDTQKFIQSQVQEVKMLIQDSWSD